MVTWRELLLLYYREELVEVAQAFGLDASSTQGGVPGMSHHAETPGETQDTLKRQHLSADLGMPWDSSRERSGREEKVWTFLTLNSASQPGPYE